MADSDPAPSSQAISPPAQSPKKNEELQHSGAKIKDLDESLEPSPLANSPKKESIQPIGARIQDLDESQSELLSRIEGLKENVQNWRTTVDTQLKSYKDELSGLKKQLESELEQLSSDFNELITTLQKQQEDVTNSLKNLGLQDIPKQLEESKTENNVETLNKAEDPISDGKDETKLVDSSQ